MTTAAGRVRLERGARRVRVFLGGELIADTRRPLLVWEKPYYPVYYFPEADVRTELLTQTETTKRSPSRGEAQFFSVKGGDKIADDAAYAYLDPKIEELGGHVAFNWSAMDHWFEEDEEVFVHARDPYTRVDIMRSSRHIEVFIDEVKVADSHHPTLLFETGLPTRYYLPKVDVRMDLLRSSAKQTHCPYKGTAEYFSVHVNGDLYEDIVWYYDHPVHESAKIAGLVSFYNEKVEIHVDGEREEQPKTKFS